MDDYKSKMYAKIHSDLLEMERKADIIIKRNKKNKEINRYVCVFTIAFISITILYFLCL